MTVIPVSVCSCQLFKPSPSCTVTILLIHATMEWYYHPKHVIRISCSHSGAFPCSNCLFSSHLLCVLLQPRTSTRAIHPGIHPATRWVTQKITDFQVYIMLSTYTCQKMKQLKIINFQLHKISHALHLLMSRVWCSLVFIHQPLVQIHKISYALPFVLSRVWRSLVFIHQLLVQIHKISYALHFFLSRVWYSLVFTHQPLVITISFSFPQQQCQSMVSL